MSDIFEKRTLRDALRVVFRRWPVFLVAASVVAIGLICGAHYLPLKYTGMTIFQRRLDPGVDTLRRESFESMKRTLKQGLGGRDAVRKVITELIATKGLPAIADIPLTNWGDQGMQELVAAFQKRLQIHFQVESATVDQISVEFTHKDREMASEIPNCLVKNYIEKEHKETQDSLAGVLKFLKDQASVCSDRRDELEKQKLEFQQKHEELSLDNPDALKSRAIAVESDLETLRLQKKIAEAKLAGLKALESQMAEAKPGKAEEATQAEVEYARLQTLLRYTREDLDVALTVRGYTELHPEVKVLRGNIATLKARIADVESRLPRAVVAKDASAPLTRPENLQTALATAQSEVDVTSKEIERLETQFTRLKELNAKYPVVLQEYSKILDKIRDVEDQASRWKRQQDEIQMALNAEVAKKRTRLESMQRAEMQFRPSSPRLLRVLAIAFIGGLAFSGGLVFLLNLLDRSVGTTEEATKYFSVPVHGVIGEIVTARRRLKRQVWRWVVTPAVTLVMLCALVIATFSVTLCLRYPEQYTKWREAPAGFVYERTMILAEQLWQRIRS